MMMLVHMDHVHGNISDFLSQPSDTSPELYVQNKRTLCDLASRMISCKVKRRIQCLYRHVLLLLNNAMLWGLQSAGGYDQLLGDHAELQEDLFRLECICESVLVSSLSASVYRRTSRSTDMFMEIFFQQRQRGLFVLTLCCGINNIDMLLRDDTGSICKATCKPMIGCCRRARGVRSCWPPALLTVRLWTWNPSGSWLTHSRRQPSAAGRRISTAKQQPCPGLVPHKCTGAPG